MGLGYFLEIIRKFQEKNQFFYKPIYSVFKDFGEFL